MIDLDKVKIVLWDFDNTLAIHKNCHTLGEREFNKDVFSKGIDTWKNCLVSPHIKKFMDYCEYLDITQGLISTTTTFVHMEMKQLWVKKHYGYSLENFCCSPSISKVDVLTAIKDAEGLNEDQILIVDDFYPILEEATNAGFQACSPMEIVAYCDKIPS